MKLSSRGDKFNDLVAELLSDLETAISLSAPAIFLAFYRSEHVRQDVELLLKRHLDGRCPLMCIQIQPGQANLARLINDLPSREFVFSISRLEQGGGDRQADAFRALNLHREYFVEHSVRLLVWLSEDDLPAFAYHAPDLWAFRHRVFEFTGYRATPGRSASFSGRSWHEWPFRRIHEPGQLAISSRLVRLAALPNGGHSQTIRIDLLIELAGLMRDVVGNLSDALSFLVQALVLAAPSNLTPLYGRLNFAIGILYAEMGENEQAGSAFETALASFPDASLLLAELGGICRLQGLRAKSLNLLERAVSLSPDNAKAWNDLGNVYAELGRFQKARSAYQKSIELAPGRPEPKENLADLLN